jgi:murein DD-endopeptidase MepM/ murein hydrolase activator NlpD
MTLEGLKKGVSAVTPLLKAYQFSTVLVSACRKAASMSDPCPMTPILRSPRFLPFLVLLFSMVWISQHPSVAQAKSSWVLPIQAPAMLVRSYLAPNSDYSAGHRGVDYSVTSGQKLVSPSDGVIAFKGTVANKPVLSVQHDDGFKSAFEPACSLLPVGSKVLMGQPIGWICPSLLYKSHCSPWLCLHFSLRHNGLYLSPLALIGGLAPSVVSK